MPDTINQMNQTTSSDNQLHCPYCGISLEAENAALNILRKARMVAPAPDLTISYDEFLAKFKAEAEKWGVRMRMMRSSVEDGAPVGIVLRKNGEPDRRFKPRRMPDDMRFSCSCMEE